MSAENHQEWAEQRRREQCKFLSKKVHKLEGHELFVHSKNFWRLPPFACCGKASRGWLDHRRGAIHHNYLGIHWRGGAIPRSFLELSVSRALLETVQGSTVLLAPNSSPNPWHIHRTRWYLFGSTFFTRKTIWNPCINTLLLAKDTVLFCTPLKTNKWPLDIKISTRRGICWSMRKIRMHMKRLLLSLQGHWTFPCISH